MNLEDDLDAFQRMMTYMYTLKYDETYIATGSEEPHAEEIDINKEEFFEADETLVQNDEKLFQDEKLSQEDIKSFSSVRTYAIAEKYGIEPLKDLARDIFKVWMEENWSTDNCPEVVSEAFETTPAQDSGLRDIIANVVGRHIPELVGNAKWQAVLSEYGQLTFGLLDRLILSHLNTQEEMRKDISRFERQIARLELSNAQEKAARVQEAQATAQEAQARALEEQAKHAEAQKFRNFRALLHNTTECRHCNADFDVYVDESDTSILRCRACRTRHY